MFRLTTRIPAATRAVASRANLTRALATQAPNPTQAAKSAPEAIQGKDRSAFPSASAFENELTRSAPVTSAPFSADSDYQDLTQSHKGLSQEPFSKEAADILLAPVVFADIEVKPDGMLYLPEIKYRRILNRAFGPGGWGLIPRGPHTVANKNISREYALFCHGRFVAQARGEQQFFSEDGLATSSEGAKSNALMRCCKDLGIASELWDPAFLDEWKKEHAVQAMTVNKFNQTRKSLWRRKDRKFAYPIMEDTASPSYSKRN
ncbi:hypothetical protein HKX48_002607 [Thoreauomyces humboldtii]|nr:hypothetical protein HKX48_002607 [Thoreauomyces humboldtii]